MKRKTITAGIAVAVILTTTVCAVPYIGTRLFASNATPGTEADPLVSRSYVDEQINQVKTMMANISSDGGSNNTNNSQDQITAAQTFTPILLKTGQIMIGGEGTEIIPRSGTTTAYSEVPDGVSDVTDGADIANGKVLQLNHLLIVARSDGRGVKAARDSWVLVKGSYTIK